ncbi:MAG: polysaccharide biosynthesis C-terminal domain-containing protein [Chloroherpetonaceae bacterium]|nr:polysaccharide biosynthesis C-terminal domain-containing protein [Chloroherpetonaceae bacterium]
MGKLASESVHTFLTSVFSKFVLGILIDIFISRSLGPDGKGQYILFINTLTGLGLFFGFGIQNSNALKVANQSVEIGKAIYYSLIVTFIATFLTTFLILLSFQFKFSYLLFPNRKFNINTILLLITLPLFFLNNFLNGILIGKGEIRFNNYITLISQGLLCFYLFLLFILEKLSPSLAISGFIGSNIIAFTLVSYNLNILREIKKSKFDTFPSGIPNFLKDAVPFYLIVIFFFLEMKIDTYIIINFLGERSLGIYSTATRMGETIWLISDSISSSLLVFLASNIENKTKVTIKVFSIVLISSITLAIMLITFGRYFIDLLYSDKFNDSIQPLFYILPGVVFFSLVRIIGTYLVSENKVNIHLFFTFISLITSIILNFYFIPQFGLIGAATSYSIHCMIFATIEIIFFVYHTKTNHTQIKESILEIPNDVKKFVIKFIN